jgi:hypothetical protein
MLWLIVIVAVVAYLWRSGIVPFDKTLEIGHLTVPTYRDWAAKRNGPPGSGV